MSKAFLTPRQAADLLGISLPTLRKGVRDGRIPAPVYLGPKTPRYRLSRILEWLGGIED